ncbi:hypothetical protein NIIDMKKI_28560 [Mycobacterium kansasii]|uniref:SnoaL-like domain protein n=1 Tax=Mycobacterium kansasii TaxID=1768 RepID=A0A7G1I9P8_MYCKA|nr:hypothetical protein NIIDMKKI_28560 [Mycobacterium kansasii]
MSHGTDKNSSSTAIVTNGMTTEQLVQAMPQLVAELPERTGPTLGDMLRNWAEKWLKAWNSHDVDAVTAVVTDDIVYEDPSMFGQHIIGKPDFGAFLQMFWRAFPMLFRDPGSPYLALLGTGVAVPYRVTGTFTGDLYGPSPLTLAPTGRRADITGVDLYEFRDGLLSHWISVIDGLALAQQLGLAPPARSTMFRLAMRMQRLAAPAMRRMH